MSNPTFSCWLVRTDSNGQPRGQVEQLKESDLPTVNGPRVVIDVEYSSLNYKDALACRGQKGIVSQLPHLPGIDCAGLAVESDRSDIRPGDPVLVTGYEFGSPKWGGFAERVVVPADWVVPISDRMSTREAMIYGTAGFTAAQCVAAIASRVDPEAGEIAVTGATGGVGVLAIALLAKLGYHTIGITGKDAFADQLKAVGASEVLPRSAVESDAAKPLLSERWAGAVDTVGGRTLSTLLRSTSHRGVVAACGMAGGTDLPLTVFPFILRGVTLAGIDSAKCPKEPRLEIWERLSGDWRITLAEEWITEIPLSGIEERVTAMLQGRTRGRTMVRVGS